MTSRGQAFCLYLCAVLITWCSLVCTAQQPNSIEARIEESTYAASWIGSLDVGAIRLRLVFNLKQSENKLTATMDSPDQGARGIPMDATTVAGPNITIESKKMKASFTGKLDSTGNKIEGTWMQGGRAFPLVLSRADGVTERPRPQTPRPPFPYKVEEVTYSHQTASFRFAGTLTLPANNQHSPAVILISGSGAQDRDESIFEHKPFAVLADHLTRAGMAVLRVDDRGIGGTGTDQNPQDDTSSDFASDVRSALAYLRTRNEVDIKQIGLVGHSEGALIGAMVAAEDPSIAFLIMLAGPGVPGDELITLQAEKIARASGASEASIASMIDLQRKIYSIIRNQPEIEAGKREAREILLAEYAKLTPEDLKSAGSADTFVGQHSAVVGIPWFRFFIAYDPKLAISKIQCPVLAITGAKDLQVPPEQNLPKIQQYLSHGQNRDFAVKVLPDLNHLLQSAQTGLVTEYGEIEETISPTALTEITQWLTKQKFIQ